VGARDHIHLRSGGGRIGGGGADGVGKKLRC
jgi:hypothetical protein